MTLTEPLLRLADSITLLQQKMITVAALCQEWRNQDALYSRLPPRYRTVADDLLTRLESGSLFGEESCSFSQEDLLTALHSWIDKARSQLPQP